MVRSSTLRGVAAAALCLSSPVLIGSLGPRTNFNERILATHNRERSDAGIEPMVWDESLAVAAKAWADRLAASGRFEHSPDNANETPQGENLWGGTPGHYLPEDMVGLWIAEKRHFRPGTFPRNSVTGRVEDVSHYTQVMWRTSGRVGCALGTGTREEILVCRYSTAGNMIGVDPF